MLVCRLLPKFVKKGHAIQTYNGACTTLQSNHPSILILAYCIAALDIHNLHPQSIPSSRQLADHFFQSVPQFIRQPNKLTNELWPIEIRMLQRCSTGNPSFRITLQNRIHQINRSRRTERLRRYITCHSLVRPSRKLRVVILKTIHAGPGLARRGSNALKDFKDLINVRSTREERMAGCHFRKNAANRPDIDRSRVPIASEQQFRSAVP
mmetsp:Transcript_20742/g.31710  ORF Transcript_20742/g.31710 Transcript_20742/m.31710 type:complete len:209 (-) Transcript_20742:728-1354(-)